MQITVDTPYVTISELARRTGQSDTSIRKEIEHGRFLIRPKEQGSKSAVLVNMIHLAIEAAEQAERVRGGRTKTKAGEA